MKALVNKVRRLIVSEDGPTATEYALMLALIVVVAIFAISLLGTRVSDTFTTAANAMPGAGGGTSGG